MFKSIEEAKRVGEKFEAGKIVPARILKAADKSTKKLSHLLKFSCDVWRFSGADGVSVLLADCRDVGHALNFMSKHRVDSAEFRGNPYGCNHNAFIGNADIDDVEWLSNLNKEVFGRVAGEM